MRGLDSQHLYILLIKYRIHIHSSGSPVFGMGRPALHHGAEGSIRIQREQIYFYGNLQRISSYLFFERFDVSMDAHIILILIPTRAV